MGGLSRAQLDKAESRDFALGAGPLRPKDAATLILLDRSASVPRVLMGRRHQRHTFMPGRYVFPGGRTDPGDGRIRLAATLHPDEASKLRARAGRLSDTRARAIAMSAIRETYEEAGLLLGRRGDFRTRSPQWQAFVEAGIEPCLDRLRLIARAITPPGRVRRYDTRFLATFRDDVAVELPQGGPTEELEELLWLPIAEAMEHEIPMITRTVLKDLQDRLTQDPDLKPGGAVPFYAMRGKTFKRELL
ncbi:NUDIX hydrolase [Nitratireductor basaltis]|nr:NUDIX hydrolase [Nitratireductor basaltis]